MPVIYIISDLHLSHSKPKLTSAFENFSNHLPCGSRLIIAGDFFDFFIGICKKDPLIQRIKLCLHNLRKRKVAVDFLRGNRDFLVNKRDAAFFEMKLLPECCVLETPQGKALLIHGDLLCTNDKSFVKFRKIAHNTLARLTFRALPYRLRLYIGQKIRQTSYEKDASRTLSPSYYGAVSEEATKLLTAYDCKILIHGHFHIFEKKYDEYFKGSVRLGLGAWGETLSFVKIDDKNVFLCEKPPVSKRS